MKTKVVTLAVVLCLLVVFTVQAADVTLFVDCVERQSESGAPRVWLGYTADEAVEVSSALLGIENDGTGFSPGFAGYTPPILSPGTHGRVFNVEFPGPGYEVTWMVWGADFERSLTFDEHVDAPECDPAEIGTGEPDGGLDTITVYDVAGEAFTWEVRDVWDNWHQIDSVVTPLQCEDGRCFTRLVLGVGVTTDPDDYRATAAAPPD